MAGDQVDAATCQTDREEKIEEISIEELCQGPLTAIYKDILEGNPNATNQSITGEKITTTGLDTTKQTVFE